jgi:hypothetical protein
VALSGKASLLLVHVGGDRGADLYALDVQVQDLAGVVGEVISLEVEAALVGAGVLDRHVVVGRRVGLGDDVLQQGEGKILPVLRSAFGGDELVLELDAHAVGVRVVSGHDNRSLRRQRVVREG